MAMYGGELPDSDLEKMKLLENLLIAKATGEIDSDNSLYEHLRGEFMANSLLKNLIPEFVRTSRNLNSFWPFIKNRAGTYAERRKIIADSFNAAFEFLEDKNKAPSDDASSDILKSFDLEGVHALWAKAVERRLNDPEGAITVARTLVETVCKKILDERDLTYTDKEDLPKLFNLVARSLNIAPDQHAEEPIKMILGGAFTVVNGLGTLRNRLSDSHGRGGAPVKPSARHAYLAVNMAGTLAAFLVETHAARPI